jgi:hypothetical protein
MRLRDIHHYDTYVPILSELDTRHTWKQAVDVVLASLTPLGDDYCTAAYWAKDSTADGAIAIRTRANEAVRSAAVHMTAGRTSS